MAELTRKKLKEVFTESLGPFAKAVQGDFEKVHERFDTMDGRLGGVESRLGGVEARLGGVESRLGGVDQRLSAVEKDVKWMKDNASELFTKLDRFIALLEKQEQETAVLSAHVRRLEERVAKLESLKK